MESKKLYKLIKSREREQKDYRPKLIHMLINYKTRRSDLYSRLGMERHQIVSVLRGRKSWTGDVVSWFLHNHPHVCTEPSSYVQKYGSRYDPTKKGHEQMEELQLPF